MSGERGKKNYCARNSIITVARRSSVVFHWKTLSFVPAAAEAQFPPPPGIDGDRSHNPIPPFSSLLYSYLPLATFPIPRSFPPPSRFVPDSSPTQIFLPTEAIPCAPLTILKTKSVVLGTGFLSITFRLVCLCPPSTTLIKFGGTRLPVRKTT